MTIERCERYEDPPPASPTLPDVLPTRFDIAGQWDGVTDQGHALRFDVRPSGNVVKATLTLHHDCTGGRLVLNLDGYESKVSADSFTSTVIWRGDDPPGQSYVGTLTVSGTFAGDTIVSGAFINSVTEKRADNLGVCGPANGTWEATKSK